MRSAEKKKGAAFWHTYSIIQKSFGRFRGSSCNKPWLNGVSRANPGQRKQFSISV
jgi:hypothetical protein